MKTWKAAKFRAVIAVFTLVGLIIAPGCTTAPKPAPVPGQAAPVGKWSFIAVGDSRGRDKGINAAVVNRLVAAMAKEPAQFVLFPGDLVLGYSNRQANVDMLINWRTAVMDPLAAGGMKVFPVRGNHEMCKEGERASADAWNEAFSGNYTLPTDGPDKEKGLTYSFTTNGALFLNVDSYVKSNTVNQAWINAQLSTTKATHIFLQTHEPLFTLDGGHRGKLQIKSERRDALVNSLVKAGSVAFFCGHDHWYDHCLVTTNGKAFHQFIVGTAGAPLTVPRSMQYPGSSATNVAHAKCFGYAFVSIDGDNVSIIMKQVNDDGSVNVIDKLDYSVGSGKPSLLIVK